jgi:PIN domain nuclease of toxin-antitoxin system
MVVLDTHAALWWSLNAGQLGKQALAQIASAEQLGIPTIVFWETSLLVRKGKLELDIPVSEWAERVCEIPRVRPLPLSTEIALLADTLNMHADPADRFIVATAIVHGAPLATKDSLLRPLRFVRTVW